LPGYIKLADSFKAKGVDEIWCLSVNDAYVMGAWGRANKVNGVVRMIADGGAALTKGMGLEFDLTKAGMGVRSQRYSMLVEDGVVKQLNVDKGGKLEVSGAEQLLEQM
jgi:peroxiredoxin